MTCPHGIGLHGCFTTLLGGGWPIPSVQVQALQVSHSLHSVPCWPHNPHPLGQVVDGSSHLSRFRPQRWVTLFVVFHAGPTSVALHTGISAAVAHAAMIVLASPQASVPLHIMHTWCGRWCMYSITKGLNQLTFCPICSGLIPRQELEGCSIVQLQMMSFTVHLVSTV